MFTATKDITIHIRNGILTDVQHEIIGTIIGFTGNHRYSYINIKWALFIHLFYFMQEYLVFG